MTFVLYLLVAGQALALTTLALRRDKLTAEVRDFVALGVLVALTYAAFGAYLLSGSPLLRVLYAAAGTLLPVANQRFLDHFFPAPDGRPQADHRLLAGSLAVVGVYGVWSALTGGPDPVPGHAETALGVVVFSGFLVTLARLYQRHQESPSAHVRDRILYLGIFMAGALGFSAVEGLDRVIGAAADPAAGLLARSVARQGSVPPIGVMLSGLYITFLYQVLRAQRLLDLKEIVTRVVTIAVSAGLFTVLLAATSLWPADLRRHPGGALLSPTLVQATWMAFITAVLFFIGLDPLQARLGAWVAPWLNRRGTQLAQALTGLEAGLGDTTSQAQLLDRVVEELFGAGLPMVAFYLWDAPSQQFKRAHLRLSGQPEPLPVVAPYPFLLGFEEGAPSYHAPELRLGVGGGPGELGARLQLLAGMDADLVLPLRTGGGVGGWLALRDEDSSDGFSREEQQRLRRLMDRIATLLENLKGFEASREQARLAALGTMSAGLAHEIRNPLAGLKGAAQVLLGLNPTEDQREFIEVITDETDRLNKVVTSFLDYARPLTLHLESTDLRQLVGQVATLVRAQGLPPGVSLVEPGAAPPLLARTDGDKLRQVVLNLVQNAVQAVQSGGEVRVQVHERPPQPGRARAWVELTVEDTGPGLAPEVKDSLFIPFVTTKPQGTGLGLAICQRIVQAHGGEIRVEAPPAGGARFVVVLPADPEPAAG